MTGRINTQDSETEHRERKKRCARRHLMQTFQVCSGSKSLERRSARTLSTIFFLASFLFQGTGHKKGTEEFFFFNNNGNRQNWVTFCYMEHYWKLYHAFPLGLDMTKGQCHGLNGCNTTPNKWCISDPTSPVINIYTLLILGHWEKEMQLRQWTKSSWLHYNHWKKVTEQDLICDQWSMTSSSYINQNINHIFTFRVQSLSLTTPCYAT